MWHMPCDICAHASHPCARANPTSNDPATDSTHATADTFANQLVHDAHNGRS